MGTLQLEQLYQVSINIGDFYHAVIT